jgi:predicted permease
VTGGNFPGRQGVWSSDKEICLNELRQTLRTLSQSAGFSAGVIAILTIGIGANTAIFSVVNTVLLKPLRAPEEGRMVQFRVIYPTLSSPTASPRQFNIWRAESGVFQDVSAHWLDHVNLANDSDRELVAAALVTPDFFRLFGASVLHGRTFTREEGLPQAGHVVVLSYRLWAQRFGGNPAVIGRSVLLGGVSYEIVGILGRGFDSEQFDEAPAIWMPFQIDERSEAKDGRLCLVTGRLRAGVSIESAQARLEVVAEEYARKFPSGVKTGFTVEPLRAGMTGDIRASLWLLTGSVGLVLLLACANLASLLLVRAASRGHEVAIRAALGASRWRLVRQLLAESVLLSSIGGALGLLAGTAGIRALLALLPGAPLGVPTNSNGIPRIGEAGAAVTLDWRVAAFTVLLSLLTGMLFGLLPAWKASRPDINSQLKASGTRSGMGGRHARTLSLLAASEMGMAVLLLVGAALLIRTAVALSRVNPGFELGHVLTMQMSLADARLRDGAAMDRMIRDGVERVERLPGVTAAAVSCCLPLETKWQISFLVAGRPRKGRFDGIGAWTFISPGYFDTIRIPLLRGRKFTIRDDAQAPGVVIINDAMARAVWPGKNPIGERLLLGRGMAPEFDTDPARQIVGIAGNVRDDALNRNPRPEMYVAIAQLPDAVKALDLPLLPVAWLVRTRGEPHLVSAAVQRELREASGLPVARIRSLEEIRAQSVSRTRFQVSLMVIFGSLSLLLAAVGTYSVIAHLAQQRTREIAIRMAVGATLPDVRNMMLAQGTRVAFAGIGVGLAAAFGLARLLAAFLYGVKPRDPFVFAAVPLFLMVVALVAVWHPAWRASRVDPAAILKQE